MRRVLQLAIQLPVGQASSLRTGFQPVYRAKPGVLSLALLLCAATAAYPQSVNPGNGTIYVGGRPNKILIIDEATQKVTGEILCKTGTPSGIFLTHDRKRFYVHNIAYEDFEVLDIEKRQSIDSFRLSEGNKKVRLFGGELDPLDRYAVFFTKTATKQIDHFEIGAPTLQLYDLKQHKVARTIPWPKGEEREGIGMKFSPDGKLFYLFTDDVLIYDTTDFKQVDKWELSKPVEEGLGRLNFGFPDELYEEPGFYTSMFRMQDPVQNRSIMGIARVNLQQKSVEFFPLGPSFPVGFALAPGRKMAYGLHNEIGKYEFWSFDLVNKKLGPHAEFPGRPRMSLTVSSNGAVLYIHTAGNTIDLYDAATFKYLKTITLDMDMSTNLYVVPRQ